MARDKWMELRVGLRLGRNIPHIHLKRIGAGVATGALKDPRCGLPVSHSRALDKLEHRYGAATFRLFYVLQKLPIGTFGFCCTLFEPVVKRPFSHARSSSRSHLPASEAGTPT